MENLLKTASASLLALFSISFLLSTANAIQSRIPEAYEGEVIEIVPNEDFGKNVGWDTLFYNTFTDIVVAPDGSIFAASSRQHKIFKFDIQGDLVKSFGEKGQGPGDFNGPDNISILDDKYLVAGEYALSLRISLFDFDGNCVRVLKTNGPTYSPVALREGKVAYIGKSHRGKGNEAIIIDSAIIKDVESGRETTVKKLEYPFTSIRIKNQGSVSMGDDTGGRMFIARSGDGDLLVGSSLSTEIEVYSIEGEKKGSLTLNMEKIAVTNKIISRYKEYHIKSLARDPRHSEGRGREMLKALRKASWDHLFGESLPLYKELLVDSAGNILVFRNSECLGDCPTLIQAYSPQGKYISQFELKGGEYDLIVDPRRKHMCFTEDGLYALVQKRNAAEFSLRLVKVEY